jgi:hypothetical protein
MWRRGGRGVLFEKTEVMGPRFRGDDVWRETFVSKAMGVIECILIPPVLEK